MVRIVNGVVVNNNSNSSDQEVEDNDHVNVFGFRVTKTQVVVMGILGVLIFGFRGLFLLLLIGFAYSRLIGSPSGTSDSSETNLFIRPNNVRTIADLPPAPKGG
mmetsp:Transcript_29193/g.34395  ORF Transcript_29193/g.34395 Transcript_29193/m.34395 type:complete len:104 (-) Transcript_29193:313-624(-)